MMRAIIAALMLLAASAANAQSNIVGSGIFGDVKAGGGPPPAYVGPGDVVASAEAWWGMRAYSVATKGNKAINVCNVSDVTCVDMLTDATTGALVVTTVGGSNCAVVVCTVKTFYDQTGGTTCGSACDMTQATIGNRPQFIVSCISGLPCAQFVATSSQRLGRSPQLVSEPQTISAVVEKTGAFTTAGSYFGSASGSSNALASFKNAINTIETYNGGANLLDVSGVADSSFHAIQSIFNNTSSNQYVDGSSNPGTLVSASLSIESMGTDKFNNFLTGNLTEMGIWGSSFNSTQLSNMNSNQHSYWGF